MAWARVRERFDYVAPQGDEGATLTDLARELGLRGLLTAPATGDGSGRGALDGLRRPDGAGGATRRRGTAVVAAPGELPPLPDGWVWTTMGEVLVNIEAGWSPTCQARPRAGDEWGVLKVSSCSWGDFLEEEDKAVVPGTVPKPEIEVRSGDLLISRANTLELVARSVVVRHCRPHLMLSDKTLRLVPVAGVDVEYLNVANLSAVARKHYAANATGTSASMRNVSQDVIRAAPIPLPPLTVQRAIVVELRRISGFVTAAATAATESRAAQARFAAAAVHHLDA